MLHQRNRSFPSAAGVLAEHRGGTNEVSGYVKTDSALISHAQPYRGTS